jgi:hypothetical protein
VEPEREELITRLHELYDKLEAMAFSVASSQERNRALREALVRGDPFRDVFAHAADHLASITRHQKELEEARHRARTASFAMGLSEGLSIGELGRVYGFSRQLAQRFAKEARQGGDNAGNSVDPL